MRKLAVLLCILGLTGCNDDDVKDTLTGKADVYAVTSAKLDGEDRFKDLATLENETGTTVPDDFPAGTPDELAQRLASLGIDVEETSCGAIDTSNGDVCFGEEGNKACVPSEVQTVGLTIYKISIGDVKLAYDNGFYPKLAAELLGNTYASFDIDEVACSVIGQ
ncbi:MULTISPECIES: hypothetical protein [Photobacterium]|uniref:hypothetical protein n=1 Tax=Photobacterium TaxID=657 RepID=UPI001C2DCFC8|nr:MULTISPECIES: hypothetical protein [Photobacterium]MBV1839720.1 hypothetical protein [Photobacterium ganghwense]